MAPRAQDGEPSEITAGLASALLPGAGQFLQGHRRWVLFAALEAVTWGIHLDGRSDGRRLRRAYQDVAWSAARGGAVPRVDGDFEYYERLSQFVRSGLFDSAPDLAGLQPELDPSSYNGAQWRLAAEIFLGGNVGAEPGSVGYDDALAFYRERAYEDAFLWDWSGSLPEQARFAGLITDSDDRFRTATIALGAVVANHVLAAVEAFASGRLRRASPLSVSMDVARGRLRPLLTARIPLH